MDIRFGTWNVRSMYRVGSLMTVSRELARYSAGQMGGRWNQTCRKGKKNHE
jgi:hypothetical protein